MSAGVTTRLGCAVATTDRVIAEDAIRVLDHGFVRLELPPNEFSLRYAKATEDFYVPEPEDDAQP
jgi:hypothetical protein